MDKLQILINAVLAKGTSKSINDQLKLIKIQSLKVPISIETYTQTSFKKDLNVEFGKIGKSAVGENSPAIKYLMKQNLDKKVKITFLSATKIIDREKIKKFSSLGQRQYC